LNQYIQMGQARTLNGLHKLINKAVSYDSLRRWCHRGAWVEKAKASDRRTTEIMTEKHAIELAERTFNEISELKDINKQLLFKVSKELNKLNYDLKPLTGGVDSRQEVTNIESLNKNELETMIQTLSQELGISLGSVNKKDKLN